MANSGETLNLPSPLVTAVGSMPHSDASDAVSLILDSLPTAPHAPQLPRSDPREQMWIQFTEGIPRFRVDLDNLHYYFDTSGDPGPELEEFYADYLEVIEGKSSDKFAIGPEYGRGIHLFLDRLRQEGTKRPLVKVQVTGPLSFALTVTDEQKKPIFYHPIFRDVAVKSTGLKALWLLEQFKAVAETVILFFDEPSLSAYGSSAFLGVSESDVIESLDEVISMALEGGGFPGVHCCGNTDWGLLARTSTRIINFDAVDYLETVGIYADKITEFLERGGWLAWGAVPNTERIQEETVDDVRVRVREGIELLAKAGIDKTLLRNRMILTPACGCAGLAPAHTAKAYRLLHDLDVGAKEGLS